MAVDEREVGAVAVSSGDSLLVDRRGRVGKIPLNEIGKRRVERGIGLRVDPRLFLTDQKHFARRLNPVPSGPHLPPGVDELVRKPVFDSSGTGIEAVAGEQLQCAVTESSRL